MAHYPYKNLKFECTLSDNLTTAENDNRYTAEYVFTPSVAMLTWEGTKEPVLQGMVPHNPTNLRYADIVNHVYSPTRNTAYYYNNQVIQYSSVCSPIRLVYMLRINEFVLTNCSVGGLHKEGVIFLCNNNTTDAHAILVYETQEDPYAEYKILENYPRLVTDAITGTSRLFHGYFYDDKFYCNSRIYDMDFIEIGSFPTTATTTLSHTGVGFNEERWTLYGYNGSETLPNIGDGKFLCTSNNAILMYNVNDNTFKMVSDQVSNTNTLGFYYANNCFVSLRRNTVNNRIELKIRDLDNDEVQTHDMGQHSSDITTWYVRPTQCRRYVNISSPRIQNNPTSTKTGSFNQYSFFVFVDTLKKRVINRSGSISGSLNDHFMHTAFAFIEYGGEFVSAQTRMCDGNALHRVCDVPVIVGDRVYTYGTVGNSGTPIFPVYFVDKVDRLQLLQTHQKSYMHRNPTATAPNGFTVPDMGLNTNYLLNYGGDIYRVNFSNVGNFSWSGWDYTVGNISLHLVVSRYNVSSYSWDVVSNRNILFKPDLATPPTSFSSISAANSDYSTGVYGPPFVRPILLYEEEETITFLVIMHGLTRHYYPNIGSLSSNTMLIHRILKFNKLTFELVSSIQSALPVITSSGNSTIPDFFSPSLGYHTYNRFMVYLNRTSGTIQCWIYDVVTNTNRQVIPPDWGTIMGGLATSQITQFTLRFIQVNEEKILISIINAGHSAIIEYNLSTGIATTLNRHNMETPIIPTLNHVYKVLNNIYIGSGSSFVVYNLSYEQIGNISGGSNMGTYSDYFSNKYDESTPTYLILTNNQILKDNEVVSITGLDTNYTLNSHFYMDGMSCILANHNEYNPRLYRLNSDFSVTFLHELDTITNITPTQSTANIGTHVLYNAHLPNIMPLNRVPSNVSSMSYVLPMRNDKEFYLVSNARGGVMRLVGSNSFRLSNAPIDEINYTHCGIGTQTKLLHGTVEGNSTLRRWRKWDDSESGSVMNIGGNNTAPTLVTNNTCNDRIYIFHSGNVYKYNSELNSIDLFFSFVNETDNITQFEQHAEHLDGRFYFIRGTQLLRESDNLQSITNVLTSTTAIVKVLPRPGNLLYYANTRDIYSVNITTGVQTLLGTTRNTENNIIDITFDNNGILWGITGTTANSTNLCTVFDFTTGVMNEYDAKYRSNLTTGAETDIRSLCRIIFEPNFNRRFLFSTANTSNQSAGRNSQVYYWSDLYGNYIHRGTNAIASIGMVNSSDINRYRHIFLFKDLIFACGNTAVVVWQVNEYGNFVSSELDFQFGPDKTHVIPYLPANYNSPFQPAKIENMHTSDKFDVIDDHYQGRESNFSSTYPRNASNQNRSWNNHIHFGRREVAKTYNGLPLNTLMVTNKLSNIDRQAPLYLEITGSAGDAYIHWGMPIPGVPVTEVFASGETAITKITLTGGETRVRMDYRARHVHCIGIYTNSSITHINCIAGFLMQFDVSKNKDIRYINVSGNLLFREELDSMFRSLPTVTYGQVRIGGNPHIDLCDKNIAIKKGWAVFGGTFFGYTGVIDMTGNWTATSDAECYAFGTTTITPTVNLRPNFGEDSVTRANGTLKIAGVETPLQTSGVVTLIPKSSTIPHGGVKITFSGSRTIVVDIIYGEVQGTIERLCFFGNEEIVNNINIVITAEEI